MSLSCFLTILRNASMLRLTYDSSMFTPRYDSDTARVEADARVVARLIDRRLVCERRSVRRDDRRADAAQKTGGDAFG